MILLADRYLAGLDDADDEQVLARKDALDGYNNGVTGPGSCDDHDDEDGDDEDDDRGRGRGRGRGSGRS